MRLTICRKIAWNSSNCAERERAMMPKLLGRRRILIVEDDWIVAEDMSYMVEELGCSNARWAKNAV